MSERVREVRWTDPRTLITTVLLLGLPETPKQTT